MSEEPANVSVLIYDGDCGICTEWVNYWQRLTGNKVDYQPYQKVARDYPHISQEEFEKAIQFIDSEGNRYSGAEATFRIYQEHPPQSLLLWCYQRIVGFNSLSELGYRFFSRHRSILSAVTHLLWGRNFEPPSFQIISWLFIRSLGFIYLFAFVSLGSQITGLIGADGLLPVEPFLRAVKDDLGHAAYYQVPTLLWLNASDATLKILCMLGAILSLSVIFNRFSQPCLAFLFILYLSLFHGGQTFLGFQWDLLLIEAGFLAIFLRYGSGFIIWLFRWLVFRFMFLGGVVKIVSGDPTWDNLTALNYHFETQPLPSPLAWYAHQLPETLLMAGVFMTFVIELLIPFLIFSPGRFRHSAGVVFILFQIMIMLTGSYNFFNLLTICLCLFLFDDAAVKRLLPQSIVSLPKPDRLNPGGTIKRIFIPTLAVLFVFVGGEQILTTMNKREQPSSASLTRLIAPFRIINPYGPFAVMTTARHEIVIEGSRDGVEWREYQFKYKPGDITSPLSWCIPHQPRLDWQMWFAALSPPEQNPWFLNLLVRLLQNKEQVTRLLFKHPFADEAPSYIRARYYRYTFTKPGQRNNSGNLWQRELLGDYYSPIKLAVE